MNYTINTVKFAQTGSYPLSSIPAEIFCVIAASHDYYIYSKIKQLCKWCYLEVGKLDPVNLGLIDIKTRISPYKKYTVKTTYIHIIKELINGAIIPYSIRESSWLCRVYNRGQRQHSLRINSDFDTNEILRYKTFYRDNNQPAKIILYDSLRRKIRSYEREYCATNGSCSTILNDKQYWPIEGTVKLRKFDDITGVELRRRDGTLKYRKVYWTGGYTPVCYYDYYDKSGCKVVAKVQRDIHNKVIACVVENSWH
ncbi:hypothetical protein E24_00478 [Faustovirus]|nr:hypothetical protein PRJ_Fausto_00449 [Faustovirus]AMN83391.1 hypothetical protein E24_00478 [Faustovirus]AMN84375.1 hypothetical protein D5a_00476 [Faustovirus]AMN85361.1 hypothetical protein E23_00478 [Faustovirus]QBR99354.1 hypothetical protein [Faustovirus mariensis]